MNKVQEQIWIQPEMLSVIKARPDHASGNAYVPANTLESMQARITELESENEQIRKKAAIGFNAELNLDADKDKLQARIELLGSDVLHWKGMTKGRESEIDKHLARIELLEGALISLSATYGANIKDEFERSGGGSLFRDSLECAVDELGKEFSDRCVDVFYGAMKMTVNEAIAKDALKEHI